MTVTPSMRSLHFDLTGEYADDETILAYFSSAGSTVNTQIDRLEYLGLLDNDIRSSNAGSSNYSEHTIQPWSIWLDYPELTSWDHDIIKRVLRTKSTDSRSLDYEKIIHICQERLRQLTYKDSNEPRI